MATKLIASKWPFANGKGRIIDTFAAGIDLGSGERICKTSDGFAMNVLADDLIGRHLLLSGQFDRSPVQVLLNQARPGDVLMDIGANIGYVSGCFLANVAAGRAICIEPQLTIADLLRKNMAGFPGRAEVHQIALSDGDGEGWMQIDTVNRGRSAIAAETDEGTVAVKMVSAASFFSRLDRLDLIKIDVEGHEEPIFRSIEQELKRLRPRAILFEDHSGEAAPDGSIGSILKRTDYAIFGIDKKLLKTGLVEIGAREDCTFSDYIALRVQL